MTISIGAIGRVKKGDNIVKLTEEKKELLKASLERIELGILRIIQTPEMTLDKIDAELRDIRNETHYLQAKLYQSTAPFWKNRLIGAGMVEIQP